MSEVMLSELIAEAEWLLMKEGQRGHYWTKTRFPFKLKNWSDIDVIAYNPETKHLVFCESKVQGQKTLIRGKVKENDRYVSFVKHIPHLAEQGVLFDNFGRMVKKLTVKLVSNLVLADKDELINKLETEIQKALRKKKIICSVAVELETTFEVLTRIIYKERENNQGRRYGNPVLDLVREINRYAQSPKAEKLMREFDKALKPSGR